MSHKSGRKGFIENYCQGHTDIYTNTGSPPTGLNNQKKQKKGDSFNDTDNHGTTAIELSVLISIDKK